MHNEAWRASEAWELLNLLWSVGFQLHFFPVHYTSITYRTIYPLWHTEVINVHYFLISFILQMVNTLIVVALCAKDFLNQIWPQLTIIQDGIPNNTSAKNIFEKREKMFPSWVEISLCFWMKPCIIGLAPFPIPSLFTALSTLSVPQ